MWKAGGREPETGAQVENREDKESILSKKKRETEEHSIYRPTRYYLKGKKKQGGSMEVGKRVADGGKIQKIK